MHRYADDAGIEPDYIIVVELARHLLGENWLPDYVAKANSGGGIERNGGALLLFYMRRRSSCRRRLGADGSAASLAGVRSGLAAPPREALVCACRRPGRIAARNGAPQVA